MMGDIQRNIYHFHLFPGSGGGKKGFQRARPRIPGMQGNYVYVGGIDFDATAVQDCDRLGGYRTTVRDLASREQYIAINGHEPPPGWREVTPADIRVAAHGIFPHAIFLSPPCKGFSGLLSQARSKSDKYEAMNGLGQRALWLTLEAFKDNPPEFILLENVPLIMTRGRHYLDQMKAMVAAYGYISRETKHDCGEVGGLAQHRQRFLMVCRHAEKMPAAVYEPPRRPLRSVGEILDRMHLPGDPHAGPMHRVPRLAWKTWLRLALVRAGSDWRSLNELEIKDGYVSGLRLVPEVPMHDGVLGVRSWDKPAGVVAAASRPNNGAFSVADPRFAQSGAWHDGHAYGVLPMSESARTIGAQQMPGQGYYSVADPRHHGHPKHNNEFRIVRFAGSANAVTSAHGTGQCVADPRGGLDAGQLHGKYRVTRYDEAARAVIAGNANGAFAVADVRRSHAGRPFSKYPVSEWNGATGTVIGGDDAGAYAVADPRPGLRRERGDSYLTAGHYGVRRWEEASGAVSAAAGHDNGIWSVADPRAAVRSTFAYEDFAQEIFRLPAAADKLVCRIQALDGTWHRPFTTLELAALQSYYDPDDFAEHGPLLMAGTSDGIWREHIGNMVPPDAAQALAEEIGRAILLSWAGETFQLSSTPIWVRPLAIAIAVRGGEEA